MASTSTAYNDDARELLRCALEGGSWPDSLIERMAQPDAAPALFAIVIERLGDLFEPALCEVYATLFSRILARVRPDVDAPALVGRYRRVRTVRPVDFADPADVIVLSRVTLGADVAVTSLALDAARRRFPQARVHLAGPRKTWELFGTVEHLEVPYVRRGSIEQRLASWPLLRAAAASPRTLVIDPDSRLTQLGLLPVCEESRYAFFESRGYGGAGNESLPVLTRRWIAEVLGVDDARAWMAPVRPGIPCRIAVSLGIGGNEEKRMPGNFEGELLRGLAGLGHEILVDKGGDEEEAARVERAIAGLSNVRTWQGDYATFAASIAGSSLYLGYDSAGQHVAAACGVPLVSIFRGAISDRFFARWSPAGPPGSRVIRADTQEPGSVLEQTLAAARDLL